MAEDWGPFGNLRVSRKKILFFSHQRVKSCFENIRYGGNGKLYERMLGCASDTYFYVGFQKVMFHVFFIGQEQC
jgi:hypothetical protein